MAEKRDVKRALKKVKSILADKAFMFSLVGFILSLFLLDVNANNIGAYGIDTLVGFFNDVKVPATSMFWTGFILACTFFSIIAVRSMYHSKRYPSRIDFLFALIGGIGLMIILSGGLLLFWHKNDLIIPFFSYDLTRITYYHAGIALELISVFYFALTK